MRFVVSVGYANAELGQEGGRKNLVVIDSRAVSLLNAGPFESSLRRAAAVAEDRRLISNRA